MTIVKTVLTGIAALLAFACEPEDLPLYMEEGPATDGNVSVALDLSHLVAPGTDGTKVSLLDGVESRCSGAQVLVFQDGLLTSAFDLAAGDFADAATAVKTLSVRKGVSLTLLVTGNLWAVDKASPTTRKQLLWALGTAFPTQLADVRNLPFRLDGSDIPGATGYRYEKFSEVATLGIPFSGEATVTVASDEETITIPCRRLFAKVSLTVDHSGLVGASEDASWFRNSKLYLRGASAVLRPFDNAGTVKVTSVSDILAESDYDAAMSNGGKLTFAFYVPENVHGTAPLPSNADPAAKTCDNLSAYAYRDCLTYVEFTGTVDGSAGGYSGTYTYRFYVGGNTTDDFSVVRNRRYDITLGFSVNSLFDPSWKVSDGGTLTDGRRFCLTADAAGTTALPDGQMVAVRGNRPGTVYVYMNRGGALGDNHMKGHGVVDAGFVPAGLSDCGWSCAFLSSAGVCTDATLTSWGVTPAYDSATGALTFTVSEPARYASHVGEEADLTLRLLPGDREVTLKVKLYPDLAVAPVSGTLDGDDFFVGMKRSVKLSGFVSPTVSVRNSASGVSTASVKVQSDGGGRVYLQTSAASVPSDRDLHLYSYTDNGLFGCPCTLEIASADTFNDGPAVSLPVRARAPYLKNLNFDSELLMPKTVPSDGWVAKAVSKGELSASDLAARDHVVLYVKGDECAFTPTYFTDGSYSSVIPRDAFDEETYQERMKPRVHWSAADDYKLWFGDRVRTSGGSPVIDPNGYEVYEVFFSASGAMSLFYPDRTYDFGDFYTWSEGSNNNSPFTHSVIPAVYSDSYRTSIKDYFLDDYSLVDATKLRSDLQGPTTITDPDAKTNYYGARRPEDVDFYFKPRLEASGKSFANHCLHGSLDRLEDGQITFRFEDPDIDDPDIKHSVGEHEIYPSIVNRHSGYRINAASPIGNFLIHVFVHLPFGTELSIARYDEEGNDIVETRYTTRPAFVTDKCSVVDRFEKYEAAPICYPYVIPDVESGALRLAVENATYAAPNRMLQYVWRNPDDAVPALRLKMWVDDSWAVDSEKYAANGILSSYWSARTMEYFLSLNTGTGLNLRTTSDLEFFQSGTISSPSPHHMDMEGLAFNNWPEHGYYVADRLQDICPSTKGWNNLYYGTRLDIVDE